MNSFFTINTSQTSHGTYYTNKFLLFIQYLYSTECPVFLFPKFGKLKYSTIFFNERGTTNGLLNEIQKLDVKQISFL